MTDTFLETHSRVSIWGVTCLVLNFWRALLFWKMENALQEENRPKERDCNSSHEKPWRRLLWLCKICGQLDVGDEREKSRRWFLGFWSFVLVFTLNHTTFYNHRPVLFHWRAGLLILRLFLWFLDFSYWIKQTRINRTTFIYL